MIWCRFHGDDGPRYGYVEGDNVVEVTGLPWAEPDPTGKTHPLASLKFLVPVVPSTFYCAGINYRDHVRRTRHVLQGSNTKANGGDHENHERRAHQ